MDVCVFNEWFMWVFHLFSCQINQQGAVNYKRRVSPDECVRMFNMVVQVFLQHR